MPPRALFRATVVVVCLFDVLRVEPSSLFILGRCPATELYPSSWLFVVVVVVLFLFLFFYGA
jgi:hypothetical protein